MSSPSQPVGRQRWRSLLFLHWPMPVEALRALVPAPLEIDRHAGVAYVGLVPFEMHDVRPWRNLPPLPTAAAFPETNVRTYVTLDGEPGVWFFSLDAASTLAVIGARLGFGLPYFRARMTVAHDGARVRYRSRRLWPGPRPAELALDYTAGAPLGAARPGTLEHFLVERYVLFARGLRPAEALVRARVHHQPYPLRAATVTALDQSLLPAAGLIPSGEGPIDLVLASDGVDVDIFAPARVSRI